MARELIVSDLGRMGWAEANLLQQDRALAVGIRARQKKAQGLPLSKQEQRLIHYYRSAEQVRQSWLAC